MPLRAAGWRNVYTIHDLIPLLHPELTSISRSRHLRLLRVVLKSADLIVTVSEASRIEIIEALGHQPEKVVNCGAAVALETPRASLPAGLGREGYLLVLGSVEPRKNITRIADAYSRSGIPLPLVIAGPPGWQADQIMADLKGSHNIVRLEWVPDQIRFTLLANARALLMPSLAEGFGLPVVEAMAYGVPVLCSDTGALAEVAGGAALLVEPTDTDALAASIRRIGGDATLRQSLIVAGHANVRRFTLGRFAEALSDAYARLIAPLPRHGIGEAHRAKEAAWTRPV